MNIGMVIVNYNDFNNTKKLLDNIKDYKVLKEIVVVDNASIDDSVKELEKIKFKKLTIIQEKENKGYSAGLNKGAKYLIDKYQDINIIFSNADIIIPEEEVIKKLNADLKDDVVVASPVIVEGKHLNRGWKIPTPGQEILFNIPYFYKFFQKKIYYKDNYYNKSFSLVEVVSGCFFMVSSKHLKDINYFDEKVFLYYEENILGVKTKRMGKYMVIDNSVKVIHNHALTIDKNVKRLKKYKLQKQSQYYFEKNYNKANLGERLLLKLTYYIGYIIYRIYYWF